MRKAIDHSFLTRLLQTAAVSLALMMTNASARADTMIGTDGAPGADCDLSDYSCLGGNGGEGESVVATGNPSAAAYGGNGGQGGLGASFGSHDYEKDGYGGSGGSATAVAEASAASGAVAASATAVGGSTGGGNYHGGGSASGGASASATAISGDVVVSSTAVAAGIEAPGLFPVVGASAYASAAALPNGNVPDAEGDIVFGIADTEGFGEFPDEFLASFNVGGYRGELFVNGLDLGPAPGADLTFSGPGAFVLSGVVPEPSTWAMLLLGFAGLGFAGYCKARSRSAVAA